MSMRPGDTRDLPQIALAKVRPKCLNSKRYHVKLHWILKAAVCI